MKDFLGKAAFITGAAPGTGLGIAHALSKRGVKIALADIEKEALARPRERGGRCALAPWHPSPGLAV